MRLMILSIYAITTTATTKPFSSNLLPHFHWVATLSQPLPLPQPQRHSIPLNTSESLVNHPVLLSPPLPPLSKQIDDLSSRSRACLSGRVACYLASCYD
ncbi:hypothetical protein BT93_A1395 [Corymbia citriodora subsp. variegata]|nr:hypothetical protein BT93_A1395 [Corymbia citriodora subsp. variegata]